MDNNKTSEKPLDMDRIRTAALEIALRTPGIKGADSVVQAAAIYENYIRTGERSTPTPAPMMIADLKISVRTKNVLASCSITEVHQLANMSDHEILRLPNMGRAGLLEIRQVQRDLNLPFVQL